MEIISPNTYSIICPDGRIIDKINIPLEESHIFPGSFDPLHEGHRAIFDSIGCDGKLFEISLCRRGKPDLTLDELQTRMKQFAGYSHVVVTNAPTFAAKIDLLGEGHTFHLGYDTATRMVADHGISFINDLPARFAVYDRNDESIARWFRRPTNMYCSTITGVSDSVRNLSSTQIREGRQDAKGRILLPGSES